jgi:hypothetical protein
MTLIDGTTGAALVSDITAGITANLPGLLLVVGFAVALKWSTRFFNKATRSGRL